MEGHNFLKKRFNLHTAPEVGAAQERTKKRTGEVIKNTPDELIQNYLNRFTDITSRDDSSKRERGINAFKSIIHKEHIIKPEEIPESYFRLQQQIAREQGHGDIEITDQMREEAVKVIQADQRASLEQWIDYFSSPDAGYPDWSKYWVFRSMLSMSSYDKQKGQFGKRSRQTTAPFPDLNREAVARAIDFIQEKAQGIDVTNPLEVVENPHAQEEKAVSDQDFQKLLTTENFAKYYAFAIEHLTADNSELYKNTEGSWVKFQKGTDGYELARTLQGHGTGWCTAGESTAHGQLEAGDFYVYYSKNTLGEDKIPRLAIRMLGGSIAEVRGVAHGQEIDPYIAPVLEEKMNEFGTQGEVYKKKATDMRLLTDIDRRHQDGQPLTQQDLRFLYEFDGQIQGFGYEQDPRISEIREKRNHRQDLQSIFSEDETTPARLVEQPQDMDEETVILFSDISIDQHTKLPSSLKWIQGEVTMQGDRIPKEVALKLIEVGLGSVVAENLKNFEGLNSEVALRLIESGYQEKVKEHRKSFGELSEEVLNILENKDSN